MHIRRAHQEDAFTGVPHGARGSRWYLGRVSLERGTSPQFPAREPRRASGAAREEDNRDLREPPSRSLNFGFVIGSPFSGDHFCVRSFESRIQALPRIQAHREQTAKAIVHRFFQVLLATQISFGREGEA